MNSQLLVIVNEIIYTIVMYKLNPHKSNPKNDYNISCTHKVDDSLHCFSFTVNTAEQLNIEKSFLADSYKNEGLWNFDVAEVFIQKRDKSDNSGVFGPYLELQVSPLNQQFAYLITRPREEFAFPESLNSFKSRAQIIDGGFSAEIMIHDSDIPGVGDSVFVNLFACLGAKEKRCYFALNINNDTNADYHKPELFKCVN